MKSKRREIKRSNRAQLAIEFAVLLAILVAALLLLGYYVRNVLMGKFRESSDKIGQGELYTPNVAHQVMNYSESAATKVTHNSYNTR